MAVLQNNILAGAAGQGGAGGADAVATKSLRISGNSSHLIRTPSSSGNRKTWTFSCWVKRSGLGTFQKIFGNEDSSEYNGVAVQFRSDDRLQVYDITTSTQWSKITDRVFRDTSSWYHLVIAVDTTQSTPADRFKLYINGTHETHFTTNTNPTENAFTQLNDTTAHGIGRSGAYNAGYFNGYLADIYFIDGSQLDHTSFGAPDDNGVWQAAKFSGNFGTNGFHLLDFANEETIGHDSSGNNNDFTANNLTGVVAPRQGYNGGDSYVYSGSNSGGGGGGGAGGAGGAAVSGSTAGAGGSGRASTITGSSVTYGGGGGGGSWGTAGGAAGSGGGGAGKLGGSSTGAANPGTDGLGGGGGGAGYASADWQAGGDGGSGRVIIRYATSHGDLTSANSGSKTTSGSDTIYQWTTVGSGSITFPGSSSISVQYLVLGGGGGAETGGGGGGGMLEGTLTITGGTSHTVTVGDGGTGASSYPSAGAASNGGSSVFSTLTALGGGRGGGGDSGASPTSGGAGGGGGSHASAATTGGAGTGQNDSDLDVLFDVPTNGTQSDTGAGGEVSGNYAVLNPLDTKLVHSNGNLDATSSSSQTWVTGRATVGMFSGKFYWEITVNTVSQTNANTIQLGVSALSAPLAANDAYQDSSSWVYANYSQQKANGGSASSYGARYSAGDTVGVAFDADNGTLAFYVNGVSQGVAYTGLDTSLHYGPVITLGRGGTGTSISANFGQREFAFDAPSSYKALNTASMTPATIADGSDNFDVVTYTGNGGTQTLGRVSYSSTGDQSITSIGQIFNGSTSNGGYFSGTGTNKTLTTTPFTISTQLRIYNNFRSDGTYAICLNGSCINVPGSGTNSSAFRWSTVDLSSLTLPLDVTNLGYSLSQNSGNTIMAIEVDGNVLVDGTGPGLNFQPDFVWIKRRDDSAKDHNLYDAVRGASGVYYNQLVSNVTSVENNNSSDHGRVTALNSDGFTVDSATSDHSLVNDSGDSYVGWAWKAGSSNTPIAAGSLNSSVYNQTATWTGDVTTNGGTSWFGGAAANVFDGSTSTFVQGAVGGDVTFTPTTGISVTSSMRIWADSGSGFGVGNGPYTITYNGTQVYSGSMWSSPYTITAAAGTTFSSLVLAPSGGEAMRLFAVEIDGKLLVNSGASVTNVPAIPTIVRANPSAGFSIATYTGSSNSGDTLGHGLNAEPELVIVKARTKNDDWRVYHKAVGTGHYLQLNNPNGKTTTGNWQSVSNTTLGLNSDSAVNSSSYNYVAYFFAPVAGYSAIGSWVGGGSTDVTVVTGFVPRFVLAKNSSGSFNWFIADSKRATGNPFDELLYPNESITETTSGSSDNIRFNSNGFTIEGSGNTINQSGSTFIYLAIAENPFQANGGLAR